VRLQESAGLDVVSDGEMRRLNFQDSFGAAVEGYDAKRSTLKVYERRVEGSAPLQRWDIAQMHDVGTAVSHRRPANARLALRRNVPLEEYQSVSKLAAKPVKVSLIGPDRIAQRFDYQASSAVYRDLDDFVADVVSIERAIVESLVKAGCRYIHIDAPGFTAYVDEPSLAQMRARGRIRSATSSARSRPRRRWCPVSALMLPPASISAAATSAACGTARAPTTRSPSACSTSCRTTLSARIRQPARRELRAAALRAQGQGGRARPGQHQGAELETVEALKRRIDEAAKILPLEQLAISPQCGFASDVVGNLLSADEQKRKLERVVETARQVWESRSGELRVLRFATVS
jgi:5-methyltetrahydropteroyltriglutamate--homocysteine methyltransferase